MGPPASARAPWRVLPRCSAPSRLISSAASLTRSDSETCGDRLGCFGSGIMILRVTAAGLCSWRCSFVSGCQMRQCDMRATACAKAPRSDLACLLQVISESGLPILSGCLSPLPLGPAFAFQEIGLGLLPTATGGRATQAVTQPTSESVTALLVGGILVPGRGDGRCRSRRVRVRAGHVRRRFRFSDEHSRPESGPTPAGARECPGLRRLGVCPD